MMRYLRMLADKDLALDRTMIPLGSCTMKLNAAAEMEPITWPEFGRLHPFAPSTDTPGIRRLIADLEQWLADMTGYDAVSLQPNAGSQGEYAGLLAIHNYHAERGESHRDVCLIPSSAHGTNAASAAMAGMRVVVIGCRENGDVDLDDLRSKISEHANDLAALMITYRRRTASTNMTSPTSAPLCTMPAVRCASTARTSTRWSVWPGQASSAATSVI